jgi:IS4 transposase
LPCDLAQVLIRQARRLYAGESHGLDIDEMVYALDASTIDLCLSMFPWAHFRRTKAAVKLHTMIDLKGSIPVFISITDGCVHDVNILDDIDFEPGSIYVMDRGYVDFARLYRIHQAGAFFVTRAKSNMAYYVSASSPVDKNVGLRCDQRIGLKSPKSKRDYPNKLRRVRYIDEETGKSLAFISNHFRAPATTVTKIYKSRWQIELFFKWIKQNLRIKAFYGTSENAVKTQIWIAISVYLMVACLNKIHRFDENLSRILQVLSVNAFRKELIHQLFTKLETRNSDLVILKHLTFNDF